MTQLRISALGTPEIWHGNEQVKLPTRKALALLVYLAVEGGMQRRDKLIALLWPDSDDQQGRASLRNTLAYINTALRVADAEPHIEATRDTIAILADDMLWVDVHQLALRRLLPGEDSLGFYGGEFLEGFSLSDSSDFDDWVSLRREQFHNRLINLLQTNIEAGYADGDLASALVLARYWVAHDQLNEAAHQWLMRLLIAHMDRAGALQAYQRLQRLLESELGISPSAETEALRRRFSEPVPPLIKSIKDTAPLLPEIPFVGRAVEFGELTRIFRSATAGRTQGVAIIGEAGMGKSALALQFSRWAQAEGALVLQGRSFESQNPLPYYPITELLRTLYEHRSTDIPFKLRPWLQRLIPELKASELELSTTSADVYSGLSQSQMFEAVAEWLHTEALRIPLLLFLDDIQWLDHASQDLLLFVTRKWVASQAHICLLINVRLEDLQDNAALAEWLASLNRELTIRRIALQPLEQADTVALVRQFGASDPASYGSWLFNNAKGHPFYTVETIKDLIERGTISRNHTNEGYIAVQFGQVPPTATYIPSAVRDLILRRLARLSPNASVVLAACSVLGQDIQFEIVSRVSNLDDETTLNCMDELVGRLLIIESGSAPIFNFAHDKIREVTYEKLNTIRKRTFHRRAYEALGPHAPPAILIQHALHADILDKALLNRLCIQAGNTALELFAVRDAIYYYELARQLSQGLPFDGVMTLNLARAYELSAQAGPARALYEEILAQPGMPTDVHVSTMNRLAMLLAQSFDLQRSVELLQKALVIAHSTGDAALRAEAQLNLANISYYGGDFDNALIYGEGALKWARELNHSEFLARSQNLLAYIYSAVGQQQAARTCAEAAVALYASLGNRAMEIDSLGIKANALLRYGDTAQGLDLAKQVFEMAVQLGNPWGQVSSLLQVIQALLDRHEIRQAIQRAEQALQLASGSQIPLLLPFARIVLAMAFRYAERWSEAIELLLSVLQDHLSGEVAARVVAELCATCALAGHWQEAAHYAKQLLDARVHPLMLIERRMDLEIEALLYANETQAAARFLELLQKLSGDSPRAQLILVRAQQLYEAAVHR